MIEPAQTRNDRRPSKRSPRRRSRVQKGDRGRNSIRSRQNLWLIIPLLPLVFARVVWSVLHPESRPFLSAWPALDTWLNGAGLLLIGLGLAIRVVARQWKVERSEGGLVTDGIYAVIRHPLYLGSFLLWAGLVLFLGDPLLGVLMLGAFIWNHHRVIRREERLLEERFGMEFQAYRATVPALFPRPGQLTRLFAERPRHLGEGVVRERDALVICLALPVVLELLRWVLRSNGTHPWEALILLLALTTLVVAWVGLKREHRRLFPPEAPQGPLPKRRSSAV